jgi:TatD DNase family protein
MDRPRDSDETQRNPLASPGEPRWFDTHCHLNLEELAEAPQEAWARAKAVGVDRAVVIGIDGPTSQAALQLSQQLDGAYAAVGIHPTGTARATEEEFSQIEQLALAGHPDVVAIGESGLDFYWPDSPRETQLAALAWHVDLALRADLPLVLHIRDAYPEAAQELRAAAERGLRGIVHCFAGSPEELEPFLAWRWPISYSGILTYPKAENVRQAALLTPLELCLLETDAPWLKPRGAAHPNAGKAPGTVQAKKMVNEPSFLPVTGAALAKVKGLPVGEVAAATTENAERVFRLRA